MSEIAKILAEKTGYPDLLAALESKLSGSELNSLLLELFRNKARNTDPSAVLEQFSKNRFTMPSPVDAIAYKELEIQSLSFAREKNFIPQTLSPLAPFGTFSAVGFVDQHKIVSAVRGTEVLSDA